VQLAWIYRAGEVVEFVGPRLIGRPGSTVALSPDGTRAVVIAKGRPDGVTLPTEQYWVIDLGRSIASPLTHDEQGNKISARWFPDGKRIAYGIGRGLSFEAVYARNADGTGDRTVLIDGAGFPTFTPDWSQVLVCEGESFLDLRIMTEQVGDPSTRTVFEDGPQSDMFPILHPSGRFVAYTSGSLPTQDLRVYVRPFPTGAGRWQVSQESGLAIAWSQAGDRLYYASEMGETDRSFYEVPVTFTEEGGIGFGTPERLFEIDEAGTLDLVPSADGERFLGLRSVTNDGEAEEEPSIVIIQNWARMHTADAQ
jgi:dipeptidyl aminopeptidase/acylaminoacyl peptidase